MNEYKDLLLQIFDRTVKDSILVSKEEFLEYGQKMSKFKIEFIHVEETDKDDETYGMIKELFKRIKYDLEHQNGEKFSGSNPTIKQSI